MNTDNNQNNNTQGGNVTQNTVSMQPLNMVNPNGGAPVQPQNPQPITPQVAPQPQNVTPTPMPATGNNVTPTHMPSDPNGVVPPVNIVGGMPSANNQEVVINTTKHKTSYFGLFIVVILLVLFVLNVDTMVAYYDQYIKSGSLTSKNNSSDNLSDGYILIGEKSSSKKVSGILFNNFEKSENDSISFNYSSVQNVSNPSELNIYIELYNSSKHLLYKELFNVENDIEANSTKSYSFSVKDDIYNIASYIKIESISVPSSTTLTCEKKDDNFNYKNIYNFTNGALASYEVTKEAIGSVTLDSDYIKYKDTNGATLENNILKYNVDFETYTSETYTKGVSNYYIKTNEETQEWKCE